MWKWLYQFASPKLFYIKTSSWIKGLQFLCPVLFLLGFFWGVFFAPADYQQGDAFRIIYIHVPAAFFSMGLYVGMGVAAFVLLVWRVKIAGVMLLAMAQTGSVMVVIALVTGSIWGKPMWGAWWVWDARLTSELILFLLYVAILATHHAFVSKGKADKVVAILTLVGLLDLPIIHYSVYWWNTLHQGATLSVFAKPKIATSMAMPLYVMLAAFLSYVIWIVLLKTRSKILHRKSNQKWVQELA